MYGREVFSLGAESHIGESRPKVRPMREPRLDLDISEGVSEVNIPVAWTPLKLAKMDKSYDDWEKPLWVYAHIWHHDVGTGQSRSTKQGLAGMIRDRGVVDEDECAYIVGEQVGGKMTKYNVFPQCECVEKGWNDNYLLGKVIDLLIKMWVTLIPLKCRPNVEFQMRMYYEDKRFPDRPNRFKYSVGFFLSNNEDNGDHTKMRISATKTMFNLSLKALQIVSVDSAEAIRQEINQVITEAKVDNITEYNEFAEELLRLLIFKQPLVATDPTLLLKLEEDHCTRLTDIGASSVPNIDSITKEMQVDSIVLDENLNGELQHEEPQLLQGATDLSRSLKEQENIIEKQGQPLREVNQDQSLMTMGQEEERAQQGGMGLSTMEREKDSVRQDRAGPSTKGQEEERFQRGSLFLSTMRQEQEHVLHDRGGPSTMRQDQERVLHDRAGPSTMQQEQERVLHDRAGPSTKGKEEERLQEDRISQSTMGQAQVSAEGDRMGQAQRHQRDRDLSILDNIPLVGPVKRIVEGCQDISDGNYGRGTAHVVRGGIGLAKDPCVWGVTALSISCATWVATATGLIQAPKPSRFDFIYKLFK